jgi:hypothetical protein
MGKKMDSNDVVSINHLRKILIKDRKDSNDLRAEKVRSELDPRAMIEELTHLCEESKTCKLEDLERLKFRAGVVTTLLKKCLPDLRSLEVKEKQQTHSKLILEFPAIDSTSNKEAD